MKLAEPEPFGTLYDHDIGIGHIHTDLDYSGGYQYIGPACRECVHIELLVLVALLAVHNRHLVWRKREGLDNFLVAGLHIPVVHLLILEDHRIHNEGLTSRGNLLLHEAV